MAITYHNWRRLLEIDVLWGYVGNGAQQVQVLMADFQIYVASTDIVYDTTSIYYRAEAEIEEDDQYDSTEESEGDLTGITDGGSDGDA